MDLDVLQQKLGVRFKDQELLKSVLVHPSMQSRDVKDVKSPWDKLEWIGDAIVALAIRSKLVATRPLYDMGELVRLKDYLIGNEIMAEVCNEICLLDHMVIHKTERSNGGFRLRANSFEVLIGALFLDQGYEAAAQLACKLLMPKAKSAVLPPPNPKSVLQHKTKQRYGVSHPTYRVLSEQGGRVTVGIYLHEVMLGQGSGKSKKRAEAKAAEEALKRQTDWPRGTWPKAP